MFSFLFKILLDVKFRERKNLVLTIYDIVMIYQMIKTPKIVIFSFKSGKV